MNGEPSWHEPVPSRPPTASVTAVVRHPVDGWLSVATGLAFAALGPFATRTAHRAERATLSRVNGGPELQVLRLPQQLGTPWALPAVAVTAFWLRRPHLAATSLMGIGLVQVAEKGTKKVVRRRRPGQVLEQLVLRDDAPRSDDRSYPSGHAAKAACVAVLLVPALPGWVTAGAAATAALTAGTRVHQGAHFPLDVAGGVLMGTAVGSLCNFVVGRPG